MPPAPITLAAPLTRRSEGCRLTAYRDAARGKLTIGWGHAGPDVHPGQHITQAQADALLDRDLAAAYAGARSVIGTDVQLSDGQWAALTDFVYNLGKGVLASATCRIPRLIRAGDLKGAAAAISLYDKAHDERGKVITMPGLVTRRAAERAMFEGRT